MPANAKPIRSLEDAVYHSIAQAQFAVLAPEAGAVVHHHDTPLRPYECRPDFVRFQSANPNHRTAAHVVSIVEIKKQTNGHFSKADWQEVLRYGQCVLEAQPWRQFATLALCDCFCIQLLRIRRATARELAIGSADPFRYQMAEAPTVFTADDPSAALQLATLLRADARAVGYTCPPLKEQFPNRALRITRILGSGATATVFAVQQEAGTQEQEGEQARTRSACCVCVCAHTTRTRTRIHTHTHTHIAGPAFTVCWYVCCDDVTCMASITESVRQILQSSRAARDQRRHSQCERER